MTRMYDEKGNRPGTLYSKKGRRLVDCTSHRHVPGCIHETVDAEVVRPSLPHHYLHPWWDQDDEQSGEMGFQHWKPKEPKFRGQLQSFLGRDALDTIAPDESGLVIGADKRLYEPRHGLIDCLAQARATGPEGSVYVNKVDWDSFPPLQELAFLFDQFFSPYNREVLMLVGKKHNGKGWLYHVPLQEGTGGLVTWLASDGEMSWFTGQARWIGTIHIHPGSSCSPSVTDIDDWAAPEKSGLHLIFGRDGSYTINGAIAGKTFEVAAGNLTGMARSQTEWTTSGHRPLEELLLEPKPLVVSTNKWSHFGSKKSTFTKPAAGESGLAGWMLRNSSALKVSPVELESMRIVIYEGSYYLMPRLVWQELQEKAKRIGSELPPVKTLSIYPVKGGRT